MNASGSFANPRCAQGRTRQCSTSQPTARLQARETAEHIHASIHPFLPAHAIDLPKSCVLDHEHDWRVDELSAIVTRWNPYSTGKLRLIYYFLIFFSYPMVR
jgi:cytolysin (calcineurin-like family phosphatase)